eukprot:TRINITY_DN6861_c0_g1_i1.p1 TRINITY_DN6861_c0_g1~~TRINITY_DN6861_c0_g1_i1.p1  ORF type:complete len:190 (-),score=51.05 TRINITY_DN6861_c0_g1_i1:104-673(-)
MILAACLSLFFIGHTSGSTAPIYPANLDPNACPNYPFCGPIPAPPSPAPIADLPTPIVNGQPVAPVLNTVPDQTAFFQEAQLFKSPADFPVPVINGQAVAPVLNTLPDQTAFFQKAQVVKAPADFPVPIINNEAVAPGLNTVPSQTRAHENHLQISQQQQLAQLAAAQQIQIQQQQQIIQAQKLGILRR